MGAVKSYYWDQINRVSCAECNGNGGYLAGSPGGEVEVADCPHCHGAGECECPDCVDTASEAAWERQCEDYHGGSGPQTLDEQHRAAWEQKQALRR